jgi:hypothetical protein
VKISKALWLVGFLGTFGLWLAEEIWAAYDADPNTVPLTNFLVDNVPGWILFPVILTFAVWISAHFWIYIQLHRKGKA